MITKQRSFSIACSYLRSYPLDYMIGKTCPNVFPTNSMDEGMGVNVFEIVLNVSPTSSHRFTTELSLAPEIDKWVCTTPSF